MGPELGQGDRPGSLYFRPRPAQLALLAAEDASQELLGLGGCLHYQPSHVRESPSRPRGVRASQGRRAQHLVPRESSVPPCGVAGGSADGGACRDVLEKH